MPSLTDLYSTGKPTHFGALGYYGLLDWWYNEFTEEEKSHILKKYIPLGSSGLTKGQILGSSASAINFLTGFQSWFPSSSNEVISEKILKKAEQLITPTTPILDIHFLFGALIEHYYKKQKLDLQFYILAKSYCWKQIHLSDESKLAFLKEFGVLPAHKGYEQLAIILEKEQKFDEAIGICLNARQQGWRSDWDKRISRLETKLTGKPNGS